MGLPAVGWKVQVCLPCVPTLASSHCCHISSLCGREWAAGHPAVLVLLPLFSAWGVVAVLFTSCQPHLEMPGRRAHGCCGALQGPSSTHSAHTSGRECCSAAQCPLSR